MSGLVIAIWDAVSSSVIDIARASHDMEVKMFHLCSRQAKGLCERCWGAFVIFRSGSVPRAGCGGLRRRAARSAAADGASGRDLLSRGVRGAPAIPQLHCEKPQLPQVRQPSCIRRSDEPQLGQVASGRWSGPAVARAVVIKGPPGSDCSPIPSPAMKPVAIRWRSITPPIAARIEGI